MKNREYWKQRFEQLEKAQNDAGLKCRADIERQYGEARQQLEGKIRAWHQRFADNNGVSMEEARKLLTGRELAELKWDVNEYIKYGQENEVSGAWTKQLENASARYHIDRLEALKIQTQQSLEAMFAKQLGTIAATMAGVYEGGYRHAAFEVQKGIGIGWSLGGMDQARIDKVISRPWAADGRNFSDRVWNNRERLVAEVHSELTKNAMLGTGPQNAIDNIARKMNASKSSAGRLVMTEEAYFSSAAQRDCFKELDVEQYEVVATLDSHTSETCRSLDGRHFSMKDFEPGVTAPPFHVYCRSTTIPYFDDSFGLAGERAARDEETGKTYYVPGNMNYEDWEKAFVWNGDKSGLQEAPVDGTIKAGEKAAAEELKVENLPPSFTSKGEYENTKALVDYVNGLEGADADVVALYNRMGKLESIESNGIAFTISHTKGCQVELYKDRENGKFSRTNLVIPELHGSNLVGQVSTTLHEEMHLMDLYGRQDPKGYGNWFSTSRQPLVDAFRAATPKMSDGIAELFKRHDAEALKAASAVNDKYAKQIAELEDSIYKKLYSGIRADPNEGKEYKKLLATINAEIDYEVRNIMGGGVGCLEDIYDALSGGAYKKSGKVFFGHTPEYYSTMDSRVKETFANYAALSVIRPDLVGLLKADKPGLVAELDAAVKALLQKAGDE